MFALSPRIPIWIFISCIALTGRQSGAGIRDIFPTLDDREIAVPRRGVVEAPPATSYTWNAGTASWFTGTNWNPNGTPGSSDDAYINNAGTAQIQDGTAAANTVVLGQNAGTSGNLSLLTNGILATSQIIKGAGSGTVNFDGGTLRATKSGVTLLGLTDSGAVSITSNNAYIDTNGYSVTLNATASGMGALIKQGAGTLTLAGSYTGLSGGITVAQGAMSISGRVEMYPASLYVSPASGVSGSLDIPASSFECVQR